MRSCYFIPFEPYLVEQTENKVSEHPSTLSRQWLLRTSVFVALSFLLFAYIAYAQALFAGNPTVLLQGSIHIQPTQSFPGDQADKIQPGTSIKLSATVENKGEQRSPQGELYIRYAFSHPLDKEVTSVIFETEKKTLPAIEPGGRRVIFFDTPHQTPSLLDFVRYDWSIREYQAMAIFDREEYLLGTLAMTFSAYYYPGIKRECSIQLPLKE